MYHVRHWQESEQKFSLGDETQNGQQLIVFPDLRTMYTTIPEILHNKASIRHSAMTNIQQAKIFCSCKSAKTTTLCTTHAGIFQDRRKLQSIICLDPFKRYYQSHQDPRYKIKSTLEKLAALYSAKLQWIHDW
jgi:primosomal protein N'